MQDVARRPYFAAGVALVGASVIAASSVAPMPDIHLPDLHLPAISTASVDLAALANPLEVYAQVFQTALEKVGTLASDTLPGQVLGQIIANQVSSAQALAAGLQATGADIGTALTTTVPAALTTAVNQLTAGDVSGAVNTLLGVPLAVVLPATDLLPALQTILTKPLQNIVNVVKSFTNDPLATQLLLSGFIAPLISTPAAAATAVQNVLNAVGTGDLSAVANAILTAPATIADGFLNGGYGPDLAPLVGLGGLGVSVFAGGLFAPQSSSIDANGIKINTGGPFAALQQVLKQITSAITPPAAAAKTSIASIPAAAATTLTLTTGTTPTAAADAATDATEVKPASEAPASSETPAGSEEATGGEAAAGTAGTATDATKDSTDAESSTPAATKDGSESTGTAKDSTTDSATKDSATKDSTKGETTTSSPSKKPTATDTDAKTGNKSEPKSPTGEHATKSGDGSTASASADKDGASASGSSEKGAGKHSEKGADKGSKKAAHAGSKGSSS